MSATLNEAADVKTGHLGEKYTSTSAIDGPSRDKADATVTEMDAEVAHQLNHRRLSPRMIQLLSLAGTVGAALFVGIGVSLRNGGPASLFIAMCMWVFVVYMVALAQAEMVSLLPYDGSFIRNAGKYVDPAYGVMTGWNYAVFQAALVCFEINIFSSVVGYWKEIHPAIMPAVMIPVYLFLNIWSVAFFGEAEFYLALGKLVLIFGCLFYTFIVMVGGNPQGDAFGFQYWNNPGAFREYNTTGALGRFEGFLQCLIGVAFIVAGPEYISMVAGEAERPRKTMPRAFTSIIYRLAAFFCLGALSVGIVVPYTDPGLLGGASAASSPYVLSMARLGIPYLDSIVNALILTSIFSSGNAYVYGTSRSLYSLALAGHAPKALTLCNRNGVPWVCVVITLLVSLLSFLQVSAGSAKVLSWWTNLVTAGQLMNWLIMSTTYLFFFRSLKVQGRSRDDLPYKSALMPYGAYLVLFMATIVLAISGYATLIPGNFAVDTFLFAYGMCFFDGIVFIGWKLWKRTKLVKPAEVDFSDVEIFDTYEAEYIAKDKLKKKSLAARISNAIFN